MTFYYFYERSRLGSKGKFLAKIVRDPIQRPKIGEEWEIKRNIYVITEAIPNTNLVTDTTVDYIVESKPDNKYFASNVNVLEK